MRRNRRAEPVDCEIKLYVYGASRRESVRTLNRSVGFVVTVGWNFVVQGSPGPSDTPDEQFSPAGLRIGCDVALERSPRAKHLDVAATSQMTIASGTPPRVRHPVASRFPSVLYR